MGSNKICFELFLALEIQEYSPKLLTYFTVVASPFLSGQEHNSRMKVIL